MSSKHGPAAGGENRSLAICVFCGSSFGSDPAFAAAAKRLGALIAAGGHSLVFGGGDVGLMGEVARAARDGGAAVTGILPEFLRHLEPPLREKEVVVIAADLQERKRRMLAEADAFVVLPGGLGTLDEYFEVLTSAQLGVLAKPIVIVDVAGYFAPLKAVIDSVVAQGFARGEVAQLQHVVATPEDAITTIGRLGAPRTGA